MSHNSILIVGSGIAGPALAYWLSRQGYDPVVVERADNTRVGGQAIDVHGQALEVVDRMGLLDDVRAAKTDIRGMSFVDGRGKTLASTTAFSLTGGDHRGPDVELMRSDLTDLLLTASRDACEYVYGDTLLSIDDTGSGVEVTFSSDATRQFDLVIGADGVNSSTRTQVFHPDTYRIDCLGRYIAIATIPNFLNQDRWEIFYAGGPDRRVCYFAGKTATRAMFTKTDPHLGTDRMTASEQHALLQRHFGADGWHTPRLLAEAEATDEFYFDDLRQVRMDTWSRGRVALVGMPRTARPQPPAWEPPSPSSGHTCWPANSVATPTTTPRRSPATNTGCARWSPRVRNAHAPAATSTSPRPSSGSRCSKSDCPTCPSCAA